MDVKVRPGEEAVILTYLYLEMCIRKFEIPIMSTFYAHFSCDLIYFLFVRRTEKKAPQVIKEKIARIDKVIIITWPYFSYFI